MPIDQSDYRVRPIDYIAWRSKEYKKVRAYCEEQARKFQLDLRDVEEALRSQAELGPFSARLRDLAGVCLNNPDASFWLQRRGSEHNVGRPVTEFKLVAQGGKYAFSTPRPESGEDIGICLRRPDIVSDKYLRFWFEMLWRKGFWKQHSYGTLNLKHIRISDAEQLVVSFKP